VKAFRKNLPENLKGYGATLDSSSDSSEDLTVQIVDTTARLNSNKTLRDRLQKLLAERPGKLGELLEIERELARVQGEIDATESILAAMRLRVAMADLTLGYQAMASPVSQSVWRPVGEAFGSFVPNISYSIAFIVQLVSSLLVWVLLIGASIWGALRLMGRRKPKRAAAPRPQPPVPPPG
jgi:hypothetical protein